jgi:4'-phosphopantetheinyl transferase
MLRLPLQHLPPHIRDKAAKFRRWQDAHASIFGKHLLKIALRAEGFLDDLSALQYTPYGRPYLPDGPDFNIAHSGNRVVCIIGRQGRVGIDIEESRTLDIHDFKNNFSKTEWEHIIGSPDPLPVFYHYWTAKESIVKADGRGLKLLLRDIQIEDNVEIPLDTIHWHLRKIPFFSDYACHIATECAPLSVNLREVTVPEIMACLRYTPNSFLPPSS